MQWTGPSTAKGKVGTPAPVSSQTTAELIAMECCETHGLFARIVGPTGVACQVKLRNVVVSRIQKVLRAPPQRDRERPVDNHSP